MSPSLNKQIRRKPTNCSLPQKIVFSDGRNVFKKREVRALNKTAKKPNIPGESLNMTILYSKMLVDPRKGSMISLDPKKKFKPDQGSHWIPWQKHSWIRDPAGAHDENVGCI